MVKVSQRGKCSNPTDPNLRIGCITIKQMYIDYTGGDDIPVLSNPQHIVIQHVAPASEMQISYSVP